MTKRPKNARAKVRRMKAWEGWCRVNREGESVFGMAHETRAFAECQQGERIAPVRVVEVRAKRRAKG